MTVKKLLRNSALAIAGLTAAGTSLASISSAYAANCKDVTVYVKQTHASGSIQITKYRYKDNNSGNTSAWHTENVPLFVCEYGKDCNSTPQELTGRRNHNLYEFQFRHRHGNSGSWHWSGTVTPRHGGTKCVNNKHYNFDLP